MDIRICITIICCHSIREYHPWIRSLVSDEKAIKISHLGPIANAIVSSHSSIFCFVIFAIVSIRFNYRATAYMVERGFYQFLNWFDERAWYPLGRIVGGTVYPGLMITSGGIHWLLHAINIPVHIRDICVFLAPIFRYEIQFSKQL